MQFDCVNKTAWKTEVNVLWHSTGFTSGLSVFFLSSLCLLVCVTTVDKNKAVVCCGFPWASCAVLCVKDDWKGQFWGLRCCLSKLRILLSFSVKSHTKIAQFNPLNAELNPISYMLALLAHHFLHVSRIRVKSLTLRLLMSYIYGAPILDVSRSHTTTQHSR